MSYLDWVRGIYLWQYDVHANEIFVHCMIMAYRGADTCNKIKLANAFPDLAQAIHDWEIAGNNGDDLFKRMNIGHFAERKTQD